MDKQEYKLRAEEIKSLIAKRDFFAAAKIADEIDWTRVRSVAMLCTVSDLYKANRRYKDSKKLLLMAYDRHPNGRMILYSLCELCIKMGEVVQAVEYYKGFVKLAPMDNGKYVLQYKLYVAQDVSLDERIDVLKELKKRDYREKWGYELAYLYHRRGLVTECVDECDELILWFTDGKYVKKAMELKMLYEPLTPSQEASYHSFVGKKAELPKQEPVIEKSIEEQIKEPSVNVGEYNTIDLQKAIAESMKKVLSPVVDEPVLSQETDGAALGEVTSQIMAPMFRNTSEMQEVYFEDNTDEMELPHPQMEETVIKEEETFTDMKPEKESVPVNNNQRKEDILSTDLIVEEKANLSQNIVGVKENVAGEQEIIEEEPGTPQQEVLPEKEEKAEQEVLEETVVPAMAEAGGMHKEEKSQITVGAVESKKIEISLSGIPYEVPMDATKEIPSIREIMGRPLMPPTEMTPEKVQVPYTEDGIPVSMADMLSQESDGQIGMVMDQESKIEKQITGQMNIEDVLEEWEKTKKEYEEKSKAERSKRVQEQTGSMFTEFEAKVRDGILEQLQNKQKLPQDKKAETEVAKTKESSETVHEVSIKSIQSEKAEKVSKEKIREEEAGSKEELEKELIREELTAKELEDIEEIKRTYTGLSDTATLKKMIMEEAEEEKNSKEKNEKTNEEEDSIKKVPQHREEVREMSEEERALFAPFIQTKGARRRLLKSLDLISLAAYTGNVIVTGEADSDTIKLAKNVMKDIQITDANFSGVIAKVSGASLNSKSVEGTIAKLNNGGLIIEKASGMNSQAVTKLLKALNQEKTGIVVILEDTKKAMKRMLAAYPSMSTFFNAHIEVEELNNTALAAYGRQYAAHLEYSIDDLGMLALQTQIEDRQTSDHIVTVAEVREIVDEAIYRANRKTIGHFFDIIFGKRYDEDDMIILREKDFN